MQKIVTDLKSNWSIAKFLLFGFKVKGTADKESDLDLLILLQCAVTEEIRRQIVHMVFDVSLIYESNISNGEGAVFWMI